MVSGTQAPLCFCCFFTPLIVRVVLAERERGGGGVGDGALERYLGMEVQTTSGERMRGERVCGVFIY